MRGAGAALAAGMLLAVLGGAAWWLLRPDGAQDPERRSERPMAFERDEGPEAPKERRAPRTDTFDPSQETVEIPARQRLVIRRAETILGVDRVPELLTRFALDAEVVARASDRIEADWRRLVDIRDEFQKAARARAQEVLDRGGYREWEARRIRVPDPDAPGRMVERLSTPYDDQREDEFILAVAAIRDGRRLRHVVRLVPESDAEYAKISEHRDGRVATLRAELLAWLGANLR